MRLLSDVFHDTSFVFTAWDIPVPSISILLIILFILWQLCLVTNRIATREFRLVYHHLHYCCWFEPVTAIQRYCEIQQQRRINKWQYFAFFHIKDICNACSANEARESQTDTKRTQVRPVPANCAWPSSWRWYQVTDYDIRSKAFQACAISLHSCVWRISKWQRRIDYPIF